ncbi:TadE/TadG family type IV pilus assembly protein [Xenophilus aerolatus]|nr:pilus assembly protein [Xenophilus aerolatus]
MSSPMSTPPRRHQRGISMTETLIALPVLIVFCLCVVQFGLIYRAKVTLEYAAHEAARAGSLNNAMPLPFAPRVAGWGGAGSAVLETTTNVLTRGSVWQGLVKGMMPLQVKTTDAGGLVRGWAATNKELIEASCIEFLNPTQNAFIDWGFIENTGPDRWIMRLPNDTMRYRKPLDYEYEAKRMATAAGIGDPTPDDAGLRGSASNKSLGEANILHLRVHYGYRLGIPVANKIIINAMKGYRALVDSYYKVLSTANDRPAPAGARMSQLDAYYLENGRFPLDADGVVGMETPVYWHPFYAFGQHQPNDWSAITDWNIPWTVSGSNVLENPGDLMNRVLQLIRSGPGAAVTVGVKNGVEALGDKVGDGNNLCPAIWSSGGNSPFDQVRNPFAGGDGAG